MHGNSIHSLTGMWYGDVPHVATNTWRSDLACPPGLSKPQSPVEGKKAGVDGPPGFIADRNRLQGQYSRQPPTPGASSNDSYEFQRPNEFQRPYGRSHSARRSRYQNGQQSPGHFNNSNFQHGKKTPNRRHLTPVQLRSSTAPAQDQVSPYVPFTPPPPAPKNAPRIVTPAANSFQGSIPSTPDASSAPGTATGGKAGEVKAISAAAAARLLDQVQKTPTQVVDNLTVTEQMAEKYHILQSEDGRTILFKKTPRGRRGGVKHRRKHALQGEAAPEGVEAAAQGSSSPKASSVTDSEQVSKEGAAGPSSGSAIGHQGTEAGEPKLNTPPQPQPPPRAKTPEDWSPQQKGPADAAPVPAEGSQPSSTLATAASMVSLPGSIGSDAGVDDIMTELRELRAAKARAEEAQEQLTQQAQLLLQEKSHLVQQMAQKEKVIKNLEERLEFVQAECEDLRLGTPNNFFPSLHEELGVDSDGLDQTSAELSLLQALLSGGGTGGVQGMGAEGAAAVAAAIASGQDGYYILDTRASTPADALQYLDEQEGSTLLGTKRASQLSTATN